MSPPVVAGTAHHCARGARERTYPIINKKQKQGSFTPWGSAAYGPSMEMKARHSVVDEDAEAEGGDEDGDDAPPAKKQKTEE